MAQIKCIDLPRDGTLEPQLASGEGLMKFRTLRTVAASMLGCSSIAAGAEPASSHVELGYEDAHVVHEGETEYNTESFGFAASWEVINHLALLVEGKRNQRDSGDFTTLKLGADAHWSAFRNTEFNTRFTYNFRTSDFAEGGVGLRTRPSSRLELNAFVGVGTLEKRKTKDAVGLEWKLGARFYVTSAISLGYDHLQIEVSDDPGHMDRLSFRYDFDRGS
jgi:hypothetical protein